MPTEHLQFVLIPSLFGSVLRAGKFTTFQPDRSCDLSVSIGSVSHHIRNLFSFIPTGNPSVTFRPDSLSHSIDQNTVVCTGVSIGIHTMVIGKTGTMSAAIEDRLAAIEGIKCILIGQCVRSWTVWTGTEWQHCVLFYIPQRSMHRSNSRFIKYFRHRQLCQWVFFFRECLVSNAAIPGQITCFSKKRLFHDIRFFL